MIALYLVLLFLVVFSSVYLYLVSLSCHAGPVFKPTPIREVRKMLKIAKVSKKDLVIDLGSGDGRVLTEAARLGAKSIGYEIDPILVLQSRRRINRLALSGLAKVFWKSFWSADFSKVTVIAIYAFPKYLGRLRELLEKNLDHQILVVSNQYQFPKKRYFKAVDGIFLYHFP